MVLQTYFHNLDNTYNKLAAINENMDDVEVSSSVSARDLRANRPDFAICRSCKVSLQHAYPRPLRRFCWCWIGSRCRAKKCMRLWRAPAVARC